MSDRSLRSVRSARSAIAAWLTRLYFARLRKKGGLDLSVLSKLPDAALLPLRREGLDPVAEIGELRDREPVSRLPIPGMTVWLVTGYDEAKAVLGHGSAFSNDFRNLVGNTGVTDDQNPGGLGFTDPPDHTRLRKMLTPEFTMQPSSPGSRPGSTPSSRSASPTSRRRRTATVPWTSSSTSRCRCPRW